MTYISGEGVTCLQIFKCRKLAIVFHKNTVAYKFRQDIHQASRNKTVSGISFNLDISHFTAANATRSGNYLIPKLYVSIKAPHPLVDWSHVKKTITLAISFPCCYWLWLIPSIDLFGLQSRPKVVETLECSSRIAHPPNQCWKIPRFFPRKMEKSPDYQHCKWGEGRTCLVSQLFCPGL